MASKNSKGGKSPRRSARARNSQAGIGVVVAVAAAEAASAEEARFQNLRVDHGTKLATAELDGLSAEQLDALQAPLTPEQLAELLDSAQLAELGLDPEQFAQLLESNADEAIQLLHAAARKYQAKMLQKASAQSVAGDSGDSAAATVGDAAPEAGAAGSGGGGIGISTLGIVGGIVGAGAIGVAVATDGDKKAAPAGNKAPTTTDDSVTTLEDTAVVLSVSDFGTYADAEGTPLAAVKITVLPTAGALEFNNGTAWVAVTAGQNIAAADIVAGKLRFVPAANANGSGYATVTYQVSDGVAFGDVSAKLTVNVTPVNDAPVNTVPSAAVGAAQAASVKLAGLSVADVDAGSGLITTTLTVTNGTLTAGAVTGGATVTGNASGSIVLSGTVAQINASLADISFKSSGTFLGNATLTVTTSDAGNSGGAALSDADSFPITISQAQTGIVSDGYIAGGTVFIDVNGNGQLDAGEPSTTTNAAGQFNFTTTATGPIVVFGGTNADTGLPNTVVLKAGIGSGAITPLTTLVQSLVETGVSAAEANRSVNKALGLDENTDLSNFDILASAAGGNAMAIAAQKAATSIVAIINAAKSAGGGTAAAEASITATLAKSLSTMAASGGTIDFTSPAVLTQIFTDAGTPANSVAQLATQSAAVNSIIAKATSIGDIAKAQSDAAKNTAPIAVNDAVTVAEDNSITFDVRTNDTDADKNDTLSVALINGKVLSLTSPVAITGGVISLNADGKLTFTPTQDFNGTPSFLYTISDGKGGTSTATVNLTVTPVNDGVALRSDAATTAWNQATILDVLANDTADGGNLAITKVNGQAIVTGGSVDITGGKVTLLADGRLNFTPTNGFAGPTPFTYEASDGLGSSGTVTVNLAVTVTPTLNVTQDTIAGAVDFAPVLADLGVETLDVSGAGVIGAATITDAQAGALVSAGLDFAADDTITVQAAGTQLSTSLQNLQVLGVDSVAVGAAVTTLAVDAGVGGLGALASGGALPQFDVAQTDNALDVTLNVASTDVANLGSFASTLGAAGVDTIDVGGADLDASVSISDAAAGQLVTAGLDFAADDNITVQAAGTQLSTSLQNLQVLGVDSVAVAAGVTTLTVDAGAGGIAALAAGGALPQFDVAQSDNALDVTLNVASTDVANLGSFASTLGAAGIDTIDVGGADLDASVSISDAAAGQLVTAGLDFAADDDITVQAAGTQLSTSLQNLQVLGVDSVAVAAGVTTLTVDAGAGGIAALAAGGALPQFDVAQSDNALDVTLNIASTDVANLGDFASTLGAAGIDTIDVGGGDLDASVSISDAAAGQLVTAGLDFAADDNITVQAAGTQLSTSLQNLQVLGVDSVAVAAGVTTLTVDAGAGGIAALAAGGALPQFDVAQSDNALDVTLNIASTDVADLGSFASTLGAAGIDTIDVGGADLDASVSISDAAAGQLVTAGLDFAADDNITVQAAGTQLSTSLQNLQVLGVDSVAVAAGVTTLTVDAGAGGIAALAAGGALPQFDVAQSDNALDVTLNIASTDVADLGSFASTLGAAGIDTIDVSGAMVTGDVELSDVEAQGLVSAGLSFADNDQVTVAAAGTQLATSLHDLQSLGVDSVDAGGVSTLRVELGAAGVDVSGGSLPQFDEAQTDAALEVTVGITDVSVTAEQTIDELLGLDLLSGFTTPELYGDLVAALSDAGIDDLSVNVSGTIPIDVSDGLAAALVEAGMLDVSRSTNLVLDGSGAGDHLATTLKTMADLGVDQVVLADPGAGNPVYVDLGVADTISEADVMGLIDSLDADQNSGTPLFTGSGEVALVVSSALGDTLAGIDGALDKLAELGFTELTVLDGDQSSLIGQLEGAPIEVTLIGQQDPLYDLLNR